MHTIFSGRSDLFCDQHLRCKLGSMFCFLVSVMQLINEYWFAAIGLHSLPGLCCWKCCSKSSKECGERLLEEVLGKMDGKPHWPLVSLSFLVVS